MAHEPKKNDHPQPNVTPKQFEQDIKALASAPPVSNDEVRKWAKKQRDKDR